MYQVLDGCLIEVKTMGELSLGRSKGTKKCSQLLDRGSISHSFLQLFRDIDYCWLLNRGWLLNTFLLN